MADPVVGRARVVITGDTRDLDRSVDTARGKVAEVGNEGLRTGDKIQRGARSAAGGLDTVLGSAEALQSTISKIALPSAIAIGVVELVKRFQEAQAAAAKLGAELSQIGQGSSAGLRDLVRGLREDIPPLQEQIEAFQEAQAAVRERITERAREEAEKSGNLLVRSGRALNKLFGVEFPQAVELSAAAQRELDRTLANTRVGIERLREAQASLVDEQQSERLKRASEEIERLQAALGTLGEQRAFQINQVLDEVAKQRAEALTDAEREAINQIELLRLRQLRERFAEEDRLAEEAREKADEAQKKADERASERRLEQIRRERDARLRAIEDVRRAAEEAFGLRNIDFAGGVLGDRLGALARSARQSTTRIGRR